MADTKIQCLECGQSIPKTKTATFKHVMAHWGFDPSHGLEGLKEKNEEAYDRAMHLVEGYLEE
jgi:hypothetical protein